MNGAPRAPKTDKIVVGEERNKILEHQMYDTEQSKGGQRGGDNRRRARG